MKLIAAIALTFALAGTAQAVTIDQAREVTADFGRWSVRSGDATDYKVGKCWQRASEAARCRLTEHWRESRWLPEGWMTHKIHVTRRDGRLCAHSTLYVERPKRYDCR